MNALFPGSFDPFTKGHSDIVYRALKIFDKLTVAVAYNPSKQTLFTMEERVKLIEEELSSLKGKVKVEFFTGLLVDYMKSKNSTVSIRGLRAISDYEYETQMAITNRNLYDQMETVFLVAREDCSYISSNVVKQVAMFGGDLTKFVSKTVDQALKEKYKK